MSKKILIIGSGFNALATAYLLKQKNYDVKIIFERNIKGVLSSLKIEMETYDLGYQFFDGLDKETEKFIRDMFSNEDLFDFKYGASSFTNNILYEDHAIPYWMSYGKLFVIKSFTFYFKEFIKSFIFKRKKHISNLSELYSQLPRNIRTIMSYGCEKHYQIKPIEIEAIANEMSTFTNFRQTLFNDIISNFLKKNSRFFDEHLASRRKSNNKLENISLYPKGKNIEYITDKLIEKLKDQGVSFEKHDFNDIKLKPDIRHVMINNERFDKVIITTSLGNIQKLFKLNLENSYEHYVSQVFVYFTLKKVDFKFQYIQVNDINLYCSRISNCSLYSKKTSKNNHVLIAEMPLSAESDLWKDDNKLRDIAWNEILKC